MFGKKPSGPAFDAWQSVNKMMTMLNKGIFLPAGTPKPIVDAWRTAVANILKDPDFEKQAGQIIEGYPQFIGDAATSDHQGCHLLQARSLGLAQELLQDRSQRHDRVSTGNGSRSRKCKLTSCRRCPR
jgi:hypothetical protein